MAVYVSLNGNLHKALSMANLQMAVAYYIIWHMTSESDESNKNIMDSI